MRSDDPIVDSNRYLLEQDRLSAKKEQEIRESVELFKEYVTDLRMILDLLEEHYYISELDIENILIGVESINIKTKDIRYD